MSITLQAPARLWSLGRRRGIGGRSTHSSAVDFTPPSPAALMGELKAASELVALPRVPVPLKNLLLEDLNLVNWRERMDEIEGVGHPLKATIKVLFQGERDCLQTRGLVSLLVGRLINPSRPDQESIFAHLDEGGVLSRQRRLVEQVEMISAAQDMHETVLNLPKQMHKMEGSEEKETLLRLEAGNKSALLGGDLLLAQASVGLAKLHNTHVVEIVSMAITDHMASKFMGDRDAQGR